MKVIIAEKPSLGRTIATAISKSQNINALNNKGYITVGDYIVTYAYGHLLTLQDMDIYFGKKIKWGENLPFYPNPFKFQLKKDKGVKEQFNVICALINDSKTDEIICAGDADREGEVIVRLILRFGLKDRSKRITRLWLPDQTDKTIVTQLSQRKVDSEYNNLYNEGVARMYVDWLLGINLTRDISSKANSLLNIGRVICPIVIEIYNRQIAIEHFIPEEYYAIESNVNGLKLSLKDKFALDENDKINLICNDLNSNKGIVTDIQTRDVEKQSPKLFSLSKLQGYCGKKFKLKPAETLSIVQSLYEKGFVTYPRTNTEYLSENEKQTVLHLLEVHDKNNVLIFKDSKRIFDDSKIESHSALMPTDKIADYDSFSSNEKKVYQAIFARFNSVFWKEPCVITETEATIHVGKKFPNDLKIKGQAVKSKGWMRVYGDEAVDKAIPLLSINQVLDVDFRPVEKKTQPPKPYTVESLGNWMVHPFKKVNDTEDDEYKALLSGCEIGTEATRSGIIDKAIQIGYISLNDNVYSIEDKGRYMVEFLRKSNLDFTPQRTVELQKDLKKVYNSKITVDECVQNAITFLNQYFENASNKEMPESQFKNEPESLGCCPWCNKPVYAFKSAKGLFFTHSKEDRENCSFSLYEKQKIFGAEYHFTNKKVEALLAHKLPKIDLVNKSGAPYTAGLDILPEPHEFNERKYPAFKTQLLNKK